MLLDGEHAQLTVQDWALKKFGNGQVVKIIRQYIEQIKMIIA